MHSGQGILVLRSGRRLPVAYQLCGNSNDTRAGYLLCDTSEIDPAVLGERMQLLCDDGIQLMVAVMHSSDRYLAVTGRVLATAA